MVGKGTCLIIYFRPILIRCNQPGDTIIDEIIHAKFVTALSPFSFGHIASHLKKRKILNKQYVNSGLLRQEADGARQGKAIGGSFSIDRKLQDMNSRAIKGGGWSLHRPHISSF